MREFVFVGTYTESIKFGTGNILSGKGEGIYILTFDSSTGKLEHYRTVKDIVNPSYFCLRTNNRFVYVVNELKHYDGKASGSVSAFELNQENMSLRLLNKQPTQGTDPCHICLDNAEKHVFVSNFMSGSVCVFPILDDGSLGEASQFIQHSGSSKDPVRQTGPHAHSLTFDSRNQFAFVPDLGIDKLVVYKHDAATGSLMRGIAADYSLPPGSGPRHFTFHPNGRFAYLINELASGIMVFSYDQRTGSLRELQNVSTVPETFRGDNTCADIHIPVTGRFVYGSNRGHDSIVIYRIDETTGLLTYIGHEKTGGKTPRNFAIDPAGHFLLIANQDSDTLVTFCIDQETGKLSPASNITVPTPVCVKCVTIESR
jgi:6-phosphogluconolactonase